MNEHLPNGGCFFVGSVWLKEWGRGNMSHQKRGKVWLGAAGIVMNRQGQWLVVRKTYSGLKGLWSLPAGFVEGQETADQAAMREVFEETGIETKIEGMVGFRTGVLYGETSDHLLLFRLSPIDDSQLFRPDDKEIEEVAWKSPLELIEDPRTSPLLVELASHPMDKGFCEINNVNPGEWFGYTCYKLFVPR